MGISQKDELRKRKGVYYKRTITTDEDIKIDFIFLDTRSFYITQVPKKERKILGDEQWRWFEKELKASANSADLILIGSSIAVLSNWVKYHLFGLEGWQRQGDERKRLYKLIKNISKPIIFLSGDRHTSELSKKKIRVPAKKVPNLFMK